MRKIALIALSSPTLFGSMLSLMVTFSPAHAAEIVNQATDGAVCDRSPRTSRLTCVRMSQPIVAQVTQSDEKASEPAMLEFTEEESDTAVAMFGCDCLLCINAVRKMRGLPPIY